MSRKNNTKHPQRGRSNYNRQPNAASHSRYQEWWLDKGSRIIPAIFDRRGNWTNWKFVCTSSC